MKVNLEQDTKEWHEFRKIRIGGSDISAIMGTSPWASYEDLLLIKTGQKVVEENYFMKIGKEKEPIVREMTSRDLGTHFEAAVFVHDEYPHFMASLDGISPDGDEGIEIKVVGQKTYDKIFGGGLPLNYYQQCIWNMNCSKCKFFYAIIYCRDTGRKTLIPVTQNLDMMNLMIAKAKEFLIVLEQYCNTGKMPEIPSDLSQEWLSTEKRLEDLDKQIALLEAPLKALKEERETVSEELKTLAEHSPAKGRLYSVVVYERRGTLDEEKLKHALNNLDMYRKPMTLVVSIRKN